CARGDYGDPFAYW
nr:immunoglobulin heavy chain junction region [Mus musculus]